MEPTPVGPQSGQIQSTPKPAEPASAAPDGGAIAAPPRRSRLSRRSVEWGLVAMLVILLLGAFAIHALLTLHPSRPPLGPSLPIPEADWAEFRPPEGGCRILQPGPPSWILPTPKGERYWWLRKAEHSEFLLVCGTPAEKQDSNAVPELLAIDRDRLLRTFAGTKVTRDESTTFAGFPAQEIEVRGPGGQIFVMRGFLVGKGPAKRVYELLVGGNGIRPDAGDAARFFDSFRLEEVRATSPRPAPKRKG
jgi:hypothetical protein